MQNASGRGGQRQPAARQNGTLWGANAGPLRPRFDRLVEARNWQDERLRVMVLQAVALRAHGEGDRAVLLLGEALALAEPGGFIRTFVDEGEPMRLLILDFRLWIEKQLARPRL